MAFPYEIGIWVMNTAIAIVILIFIYRQRLKRYPLLKNSFYGFYTAIIFYFFAHILRHLYSAQINTVAFTWRLEATTALLAAWIFGNIIPTLNFPEAKSTKEIIVNYFRHVPYPHFVYSMIMFAGIALTWLFYPFVTLTYVTPEYKIWYVGYMSIVVTSAVVFPTYYLLTHIKKLENAGISGEKTTRLKIMTYSYFSIAVFVNLIHTLVWYRKDESLEYFGYLVVMIPLITMAYALKEREVLSRLTFAKPAITAEESAKNYQMHLGSSALIEYEPKDKYEEAVISTVFSYVATGKNVVLVSQQPRINVYLKNMKRLIESKVVNIVELTIFSPLVHPQIFSKTEEEKLSIPISIETLERLKEITEVLPEESVFIFESLSQVIITRGEEKKELIYRFISALVEELANRRITFIAFMNQSAHTRETVAAYEGIFLKIFKLRDRKLAALKGENAEIELADYKA